MKLGAILSYASDGPFGSKLKKEHYSPSGARVIRLQNIGDGHFMDNDKVYISLPYFSETSRYALQTGDIVIAGLGDETHPVGRACRIAAGILPAINKADCFCLRANPDFVDTQYLLLFINSSSARSQISKLGQGTTRLRINVGNLKSIVVPVHHHTTQLKIVARFNVLDKAIRDIQNALEAQGNFELKIRKHLLCTV